MTLLPPWASSSSDASHHSWPGGPRSPRAYDSALAGLAWLQRPPPRPAEAAPIYYWVQAAPLHRDRLATHLFKQGIYANFRYWPLHKMHLYRSEAPLPGAEQAAASTLLCRSTRAYSDPEVERVVDAVRSFVP